MGNKGIACHLWRPLQLQGHRLNGDLLSRTLKINREIEGEGKEGERRRKKGLQRNTGRMGKGRGVQKTDRIETERKRETPEEQEVRT